MAIYSNKLNTAFSSKFLASHCRKVVHEAIATHLDSVNLELGTVMNHFWFSEINISPLMVQKICTSFIVQTCPDQQSTRCDPFWCRKDYYSYRIHLSNQGHIMPHKYMHGSTVGLLISKVHGLLKFLWFQPIGSMRTVLIKP